MKVLILYAHPEPKSFCGALRDKAVEVLTAQGHEVTVSDLYAMGFNPVAGWHDFVNHDPQEYFAYGNEQKKAHEQGTFADDLKDEMDKLAACDVVLFLFPLWWYGLPAILKGWVDRVFAAGFAYGGGRWFDRGVFVGKRAMLAVTLGGAESAYQPNGLQGDIRQILFPIHHGIFAYTGFTVVEPYLVFAADYATAEGREASLDRFATRMCAFDAQACMPLPRLEDFDERLRRRE